MSDNRITYGLAKKYGDIVAVRKKEGDPITRLDMLSFAVKCREKIGRI